MNLYLLEHPNFHNTNFLEYRSFVVVASSMEKARLAHPEGYEWRYFGDDEYAWSWWDSENKCYEKACKDWVSPNEAIVSLIGEAQPYLKEFEIICENLNER